MTPILSIIGVVFIGLAVIWPLSFFGHSFYADLVSKETEKHAKDGGH